jgi:hypothetical protein
MSTVFLICAVVGGTLLVCQSLLGLLGLGGHHDFGDHDVPVDHADAFSADHAAGHDGSAEHDTEHGANLFRILTFRTIVAALTFFGLTGLATQAAHYSETHSLMMALGAGALAMWGVHQMLQAISKLRADGTIRLRDAVGCSGSVYLRIPAADHGVGKVHVTLQDQTVELSARSVAGEIATGQQVRVLKILGPELVEVEPHV